MPEVPDYPLTMYGNKDFRMRVTWKYTDPNTQQKIPVPLSGYTAKMQIRDAPGGLLIADFNTLPSTLTVGSSGTIDAFMPKSVVSTLSWTRAYYDVVAISGTGGVWILLRGPIYYKVGVSV